MTKNEEKSIQSLNQTLSAIREENRIFKESVTAMVTDIGNAVAKKHAPIHFENDILSAVQSSVSKVISESLSAFNGPMAKLVASVVASRENVLRDIIAKAFDEVIYLPDFKASIVTAFSHKVARSIISNNDSLFDKVSNELKQDAIFKSKITVAISNVIEECIKCK